MSQSIQIYSGTGASNLCVQAWKRELRDGADGKNYIVEEFNAFYTSGLDRGNVALMIIPGGDACEMLAPLGGIAEKINHTVVNASFLGSCAGALVSSYHTHLRRFTFNPIPYHSKYYMPHSSSVTDFENKVAVEVALLPSHTHCHLFHAYGPAFPLEKIPLEILPNCQVLAEYITHGTCRQAENSAAALLYTPERALPRLFTGVHPELGVDDVRSSAFAPNKPNHPHIEVLVESLQDSEIIRKEICRSWFSELGLKVIKG